MKNTKFSSTRKEKLYFLVTIFSTLIALAILVYFTFSSFYYIARADAQKLGKLSVMEESEKLNNFLIKGLDVLEVTGMSVEYLLSQGATPKEVEHFLLEQSRVYAERIDREYTGIYGIINDVYIDGIGWNPGPGFDPTSRPWYKTAVEGNGKSMIVSPYLDAQTNTIMISVAQLLSNKKDVISLDIYMDKFHNLANTINFGGKGYGFIMDKNGMVVSHHNSELVGKNIYEDDYPGKEYLVAYAKRIQKSSLKSKGKVLQVNVKGEKKLVLYNTVKDDWFVVMVINTDELYAEVESALVLSIVLSTVIFIIIMFFCLTSYRNRVRALRYAGQLQEYQLTLKDKVKEQTQEIKNQTRKIVKMQENVIEGMATLIELRDGNTGEHVKNTKKYAYLIAKYMLDHHLHPEKVDEEFVSNVKKAAPLHDVGKIMIPDHILLKPGKYTPEEFEIMKNHSRYGADNIKNILGDNVDKATLTVTENIAHYHHEKWNGKGYPDGLSGENIPLCARIMAVADVFDALISKRCYKDSMSVEEALAILKKDRGSHFDPECVDIFFEIAKDLFKKKEVKF